MVRQPEKIYKEGWPEQTRKGDFRRKGSMEMRIITEPEARLWTCSLTFISAQRIP